MSKLYFIGNVFNSKDESKDHSEPRGFSFTNAQKAELSLTGLPIRVEHNDKLRVGTIRKSWYNSKSNKRWILGDIERSDLKGHYAAKGVANLLYGGLSLQHMSVPLKNGRNVMIPIEVSIVEKPRREDCSIVNFKASASTDSVKYLGRSYELLKFIMDTNKSVSDSRSEGAASAEAAEAAEAAGGAEGVGVQTHEASAEKSEPNPEDLAAMVLDLLKQNDALTAKYDEQHAELTTIHRQQASAAEERAGNERKKAEALCGGILEWCAGNGIDLTAENREKLQKLSRLHPELSNVVFEITHKASTKCGELEKMLAEKKERSLTNDLRDKVTRAYHARMQAKGPSVTSSSAVSASDGVEPSVYEASNKRKFKAPSDVYKESNASLLRALKRTRGGTTRDTMGQIYSRLKDRF